MPTITQIELVQKTFAIVAPIADDVAALFYRRLFEIDPSLESMFKGNMADQRHKLMVMLTAAVKAFPDSIAHPGPRRPRPSSRGVRRRRRAYETVGEALLWTLEKGLGPEFTPSCTGTIHPSDDPDRSLMKNTCSPSGVHSGNRSWHPCPTERRDHDDSPIDDVQHARGLVG